LASLDEIDAQSVAAGVALSRWFAGEARRIYDALAETAEDRARRCLMEWVERRGGRTTAREVQRNYRPLRVPGAAEVALDELVQSGHGSWSPMDPTEKGGRPTRVFQLVCPQAVDETYLRNSEFEVSSPVDNVDSSAAEHQKADSETSAEWGSV
jgi:hypothetical protein